MSWLARVVLPPTTTSARTIHTSALLKGKYALLGGTRIPLGGREEDVRLTSWKRSRTMPPPAKARTRKRRDRSPPGLVRKGVWMCFCGTRSTDDTGDPFFVLVLLVLRESLTEDRSGKRVRRTFATPLKHFVTGSILYLVAPHQGKTPIAYLSYFACMRDTPPYAFRGTWAAQIWSEVVRTTSSSISQSTNTYIR